MNKIIKVPEYKSVQGLKIRISKEESDIIKGKVMIYHQYYGNEKRHSN